jgi:autotransporter-associated beta strand protein
VAPHAAQDTATFGNTVSAVTLDTAETIGTLVFNQSASYTVGGSSTLTFDSLGGGGTITVSAGTANTVQPPVDLSDNTTVTLSPGTSLTLSGVVANTGASRTLTLSGAGTTVLGNANTYGPSSGSVGTTLGGGTTLQIGNSTALGSGDLSVSGNSKIQAGAALSVANNIAIADATTVDKNGNALALGGVISGAGALSASGSGSLTLTGNNTYSGGTTNTTGQLNINNGGSSSANSAIGTGTLTINGGTIDNTSAGNVTLLPTIAQNWNGDFTYAGSAHNLNLGSGAVTLGASRQVTVSANTLTVGGNISGTSFGLTKAGGGTLALSGANTFGGTTLISAGTLLLGNSLALQDSTLDYSSGTLDFGSQTAATFGGLSGTQTSQNLSLANDSAAAVTLTVNNSAADIYDGQLSGIGSLVKQGAGQLTIANATYTGNTTVNDQSVATTLVISGGSFGNSSSTINIGVVGGGATVAKTLTLDGTASATAGTVNIGTAANGTGTSLIINGSASVNFTTVQVGASANSSALTINAPGQTESLGAVTLYKDASAAGPNTGATVLNIAGGTVIATSVIQANSTGSGTFNLTGGSLTIGNSSSSGAFEFGAGTTATRGGYVVVSGGSLTYLGTDGLLMGVAAATQPNAIAISGGTATLTGITLNSASTGVSSSLTNTGTGTLYLGSVGLVNLAGNADTTPVTLAGTSTLGAIANWSSSVPIALAGTPIIQAADSSAVAHNITLSGIISGTGTLTKTGNGTLTLDAADSYTGNTTISAGTLALGSSGTLASPLISVGSGATFDVSAAPLTLGGSQVLSNSASATGIINGSVTAGSGTVSLSFAGSPSLTPSLTVSSGTLTLGALTVFKVDNTSGTPLAHGTYKLISGGSSAVSAAALPSVTVGGSGVAGGVANLSISGGQLYLVVNSPPVAGPNTYSRNGSTTWKIKVSDLLTNATDVDGDTLTLTSLGTSTHGITLDTTTVPGYVLYNNPTLVDDAFTYTVSDGLASSSASITLTAGTPSSAGGTATSFLANGGTATMTFAGIPTFKYHVQVSPDMSSWTTIFTTNAPAGGLFQFIDPSAPMPNAFYRLMWDGN